jgi:hypothetical protein
VLLIASYLLLFVLSISLRCLKAGKEDILKLKEKLAVACKGEVD